MPPKIAPPAAATIGADDVLTPREVADLLKRSVVSLERWRRERRGPPFCRMCGRIVYRRRDIAAWLDGSLVEPERARA